jgi:hypothetical protein
MPTFIKTGYWEAAVKSYKGWLNLEELITNTVPTQSTIYTADGTLTGNRTITMGSFTLSFEKDLIVNGLTVGKGSGNLSTNTFIGIITPSSISGSGLNTLVGYNIGGAFTTANTNTIVGSNSGYGITTGTANVIIGSSSAYSISTTSGNVVLGNLAYRTGVGATNVVIGNAANYNGVSGNDNVYIGRNTAQFITSGANNVTLGGMTARVGTSITTANNSTFIGYGANPLADNQTNQIVIGYNAVGLGSNTTAIGNSSTISTWLAGKLLIGTTTVATSLVRIVGLPTSSAGLVSGELWNNAGVVNIVP